ncbi:MAG TPA: glycosyl hydrolase 108 family protein [Candidatus Binataceae bacterium]|nr:glycosyl hydrolase 108 family protein [Candidatus Binataceae bacterium]
MPEPNLTAYSKLFTQAVARVLANEGGYVRLASDPGGATKFGISQRDYPELDIAALTRDDAIAIYFRDFWNAGRYGELPDAIAIKLFDLSINMGPAHAVRCLQRGLRSCQTAVAEDGALGEASIAAAKRANGEALLAALRSEAAGYYRAMAEVAVSKDEKGETSFLTGWLNRAYQ